MAIVSVTIWLFPIIANAAQGSNILTLMGGARAAGLHGAMTADAGSIDGVFFNPAGIAALGRGQVSLTHADLTEGVNYDLLAAGLPLKKSAFAVSASRVSYGTMEGRDSERRPTGSVSASDTLGTAAFSRDFSGKMALGVNVKYLQSRLGNTSASTVAYDLGVVTRVPHKSLWLGAAMLNAGSGLRYVKESDPLPLAFSVGAATQFQDILNLSLDFKNRPRSRQNEITAGMEYFVGSGLTLRGGYDFLLSQSSSEDSALKNYSNFQGGLGLNVRSLQIDYAVVPFGDSGLSHRFTLSSHF